MITMTRPNRNLKFIDCNLMIRNLTKIEYFELNDVLEVIKKMIKVEKDDRRFDALKIIYDLLYNSDSDLQTWFGVLFGHLRLPKVIIRNCLKSIFILFRNFMESFVESLYFSCCT